MQKRLTLTSRNYWNSINPEDKTKRMSDIIKKSQAGNILHKRFEEYFQASYISNNFYYKPEESVVINNQTKSWDYGIFDKGTNTLQMVVDLDGEFFHGDDRDYDGMFSREEYDERRYHLVPEGVKLAIIYEFRWKDSFERMIKDLMLDYNEFVEHQFKLCRATPFPYPRYTDEALWKAYDHLRKMKVDLNDKYVQRAGGISMNTRVGDRIIFHFHNSLYHSSVANTPSPYDAWHDDELLRKVIKNRIIYVNTINPNKILQGFNICKKAIRVSLFSAGRAKLLINKYLSEYDEIFDPFSGFSGRMLGTVVSGKKYIGQDISPIHVQESNDIINFFSLHDKATVNVANCLTSNGDYQCLFTCSPYSDKEKWIGVKPDKRSCDDWIDICLKNFKCQKYLFVVDDTVKYEDQVVDIIQNKSHWGSNYEKIILI